MSGYAEGLLGEDCTKSPNCNEARLRSQGYYSCWSKTIGCVMLALVNTIGFQTVSCIRANIY